MTKADHPSNSAVQRSAEAEIVAAFSASYGVALGHDLPSTKVDVGSGTHVQIDAASSDHTVLLEAYARQGKLEGAQLKKIAQDIPKLPSVKLVRGGQQTDAYIVFASEEAKASISGWLLTAANSHLCPLCCSPSGGPNCRALALVSLQGVAMTVLARLMRSCRPMRPLLGLFGTAAPKGDSHFNQ